jgi:hypothetical protein
MFIVVREQKLALNNPRGYSLTFSLAKTDSPSTGAGIISPEGKKFLMNRETFLYVGRVT